jgi:hypothetical protein
MNPNKSEVEYLIHLLSCALNSKKPREQENIDFSALLALAKKQQIYNIICPLIADMPNVPQSEKDAFRNYHYSEITRMLTINNERSLIYEELEENKIKFMPLKGLIIKKYYPKESMRQMSDNDILFDVSFRDKVASIMKDNGYKVTATGENSDDYFKAPYCTFEFHRTLFFDEKDFCPVFDNLWQNAVQDDENPYMYHMGIDDVYIYSVCHMYKHYSTAGCGIRFLADNYLFLKQENDKLNWKYVNSQLEKFGILAYEKDSRELAFKIFDEKELSESEIKMLETYINCGIYGDVSVKLTKDIEKIAGDDGSIADAKKKYLFKRLFPDKKKMIADYRILEKKPYLLPFYYIYRLFKGAFNSKKTINEIKKVKSIKNDLSEDNTIGGE